MKYIVFFFVIVLLSGCGSKGVIFKHQPLAGSSITTMDARQRAIVANARPINEATSNPVFLRVCAEPFPDIFTVVSSSLAVGADVEASADAGKLGSANIGAQLAHALKESGAAIEKSQTVNLLSMSLYRTCERYLNGAIDEDELQIQAMRDQRTMVSILAIEQLTNIARPSKPTVVIDSGESNAALKDVSAKDVLDQKKKLDSLKEAEKNQKASKDKALVGTEEEGKCKFNEEGKQKACEQTLSVYEETEKDLRVEQKLYDKLIGSTTSTEARTPEAKETSKTGSTASAEVKVNSLDATSVAKIADTVLALAKLGIDLPAYELCMLKKDNTEGDGKFSAERIQKQDCENLLNSNNLVEVTKLTQNSTASTGSQTVPIFYIQSLKWCDRCAPTVQAAQEFAQNKKWQQSDIEFLPANKMPKQNEVRYFDKEDKSDADALSQSILKKDAKAVLLSKKPKKGLIELWVVEPPSNADVK